MEHAQRVYLSKTLTKVEKCLNPYFNGTCSKRLKNSSWRIASGLNPYFNGTCSKRAQERVKKMENITGS